MTDLLPDLRLGATGSDFEGASDGKEVIDFIEQNCCITRGRRAGSLIELRDWQKRIVHDLFRVDEAGQRIYRRGLLGMPRKNGKSMLGAGLALYFLLADFEAGAEVYSCAGDQDQARIVFAEAKRMVEMSAALTELCTVGRDHISAKVDGSVYRVLSAQAYTKEGLNPSAVIFDEVHVQPTADLWNVMTLGSATRERPLVLGITTAGYDKDTLCGRLYDMGAEGTTHGFYFQWFEPPEAGCDWRDPVVWRSCNPGLGDFISEEAVAAEMQNGESAFRRYRLNQWTANVTAWLPYGRWDELATPSRTIQPGEPCVLALDGSFNGDTTALVACTRDGFLQTIAAWERPLGREGDGWRVPIEEVEATVEQTCKTLGVWEVPCDPYRWQRSMQAMEAKGLPIVEYPNSPARMVPATTSFTDAVRDGQLSHDGDPRLAKHIGNAYVKTDAKGPRIVKEHKMSAKKIDLAVAAVMAFDRAGQPEVQDQSPTIW